MRSWWRRRKFKRSQRAAQRAATDKERKFASSSISCPDPLVAQVINVLYDYLSLIVVQKESVVKQLELALPGLLLQLSHIVNISTDLGEQEVVETLQRVYGYLLNSATDQPCTKLHYSSILTTELFDGAGLRRCDHTLQPAPNEIEARLIKIGWVQCDGSSTGTLLSPPTNIIPLVDVEEPLEDVTESLKQIRHFRRTLVMNPGFDWLLRTIWVAQNMSMYDGSMDMLVRNDILKAVATSPSDPEQPNEIRSPRKVKLQIRLEWDFSPYLASQDRTAANLGSVLILVGNTSDSHATSVSKYAQQLWPGLGEQVITALAQGIGAQTLSDGTHLEAYSNLATTFVKVYGNLTTVMQVSEILSWLGAALRVSDGNVQCWWPQLRKSQPQSEQHIDVTYTPEYETKATRPAAQSTCWHELFNQQTVAKDYSIPIREDIKSNRGLMVDFAILRFLAGTEWIHTIDQEIIFTGFNRILYPVEVTSESVLWHFKVDRDSLKSPLSAFERRPAPRETMIESKLPSLAHFVGWAYEARILAEGDECNYDNVSSSWTRPAQKAFGIDSLSIDVQYYVGATVNITRQGVPPAYMQTDQDSYEQYINRIQEYSVVLYDSKVKTGWLVDGASALLHVLRVFLAKSSLVIDSDLRPIPALVTRATKSATLLDEANRQIRLYSTNTQGNADPLSQRWWCIANQVIKFCKYFETLRRVMCEWRTKQAPDLKPRLLQRNIIGHDLFDVARDSSRAEILTARLDRIDPRAMHWLKLVRKGGVVVLMAKDLGPMIQPANCDCGKHRRVPRDQSLLAAYVPQLCEIAEDIVPPPPTHIEKPTSSKTYVELAEKVYWNGSESTRPQCVCEEDDHGDFCRPVPINLTIYHPMKGQRCLIPDSFSRGALVFGAKQPGAMKRAMNSAKNAFKNNH